MSSDLGIVILFLFPYCAVKIKTWGLGMRRNVRQHSAHISVGQEFGALCRGQAGAYKDGNCPSHPSPNLDPCRKGWVLWEGIPNVLLWMWQDCSIMRR